jgi:hypothetical protein
MSVEKSVELLAGATEALEGNLPQYHFVYHKSHLICPLFEPWPPLWETRN